MTDLKKLLENGELPDTTTAEHWPSAKEHINHSIDQAISRGVTDKETLEIMKELLELCKPVITMEDYLEEE